MPLTAGLLTVGKSKGAEVLLCHCEERVRNIQKSDFFLEIRVTVMTGCSQRKMRISISLHPSLFTLHDSHINLLIRLSRDSDNYPLNPCLFASIL